MQDPPRTARMRRLDARDGLMSPHEWVRKKYLDAGIDRTLDDDISDIAADRVRMRLIHGDPVPDEPLLRLGPDSHAASSSDVDRIWQSTKIGLALIVLFIMFCLLVLVAGG